MIRNENGSVLIIVLTFVLAFSMLGVGSIHHSYVQSDIAEKEKASSESFWMADGAVEKSMQKLSVSLADMLNETVNLGRGDYTVTTTGICVCDPPPDPLPDPYTPCTQENCSATNGQVSTVNRRINAIGTVNVPYGDGTANDQIRRILAKFGSFDIENALTTKGTVTDGCSPQSQAADIIGNCVPHAEFSFETVFNGMTYDETPDAANPLEPVRCPDSNDFECVAEANGQNFKLTGPPDPWNIDSTTVNVIHNIGGFNNPKLDDTADPAYYDGNPAFLIIDTSDYTGQTIPKFTVNGNEDFCGIIWMIGETKINGNANILGAVFIDGDAQGDTLYAGTAYLKFDMNCVEGAIASFGGTGPPDAYVWKEY